MIIFLFPVLAVSVKNAGSALVTILFLLSLVYAWPAWSEICVDEKKILLALVIFFLAVLLSLFNTADMQSAVRKLERFLRLLAIVPIYLLFRRQFAEPLLKAFFYGSVLSCFVLAAQSVYYHKVLGQTVVSGVYHKIILGDVSIFLSAVVVLGLLCLKHKKSHYAVGVLAFLCGLYTCMLSGARGAWLFVPVFTLFCIWMFRRRIPRRGWFGLLALVAVLIAGVAIWTPASIANGVQRGIEDLKEYRSDPTVENSFSDRLKMWRDSLKLFRQHPLLGVGMGDFQHDRQILMDKGLTQPGYAWGHAHSIYFHALATTGLLGFVLLLVSLFVLPFWGLNKVWHTELRGLDKFAVLVGLSALLAFAIFGLTEAWLSRNPLINVYVVVFALFICASYSLRAENQS